MENIELLAEVNTELLAEVNIEPTEVNTELNTLLNMLKDPLLTPLDKENKLSTPLEVKVLPLMRLFLLQDTLNKDMLVLQVDTLLVKLLKPPLNMLLIEVDLYSLYSQ